MALFGRIWTARPGLGPSDAEPRIGIALAARCSSLQWLRLTSPRDEYAE